MTLHLAPPPTTPDAFLCGNEGLEGKRELVDGAVIEMMTGSTMGGARRIRRLARVGPTRITAGDELVLPSLGVCLSAEALFPDL